MLAPPIWPIVVLCSILSAAFGTAAAVATLGLNQSPTSVYALGYLVVGGLAALVVVLAGGITLYTWLEDHVWRTRSTAAGN
jgi:hypothetical protein